MDIPFLPKQMHRELMEIFDAFVLDGLSYRQIGKIMMPDLMPDQSKGVVWRIHKKHIYPRDNEVRTMLGLPSIVLTDELHYVDELCTVHGAACTLNCELEKIVNIDAGTYDPDTQRITAKPGTGRQRRRAEIYPGTPPADVLRKLAELGHRVAYVEGELEY